MDKGLGGGGEGRVEIEWIGERESAIVGFANF